jgi:hypothetical protein
VALGACTETARGWEAAGSFFFISSYLSVAVWLSTVLSLSFLYCSDLGLIRSLMSYHALFRLLTTHTINDSSCKCDACDSGDGRWVGRRNRPSVFVL